MQSNLSRRVCVYDRRFEGSKRKEEWLVTSDLDFKSFLRILSETFSVPLHEAFVLVTTERTVLDAEKYSQLQDGATLYLMQREDQTLEVPTEELIYFTPHHDTVVESGTYKYYDSEGKKALPYALADLVDNSLSATVNNAAGRTIEIRMLFDESYGKPAVIVWDNGCGMTSKQLNNWAVYKLSKFNKENGRFASDQGNYSRPGHVCRSLNSDISYFGVGGKQAAFYIGKTTRVISKSSSSPDVHELILSKALFEKKEKNKEDTYSTTIYNRKPGESSHITKTVDRFLRDLITEEYDHQSFTAVVITDVVKEHITFLKENFEVWTRQLAHIYHYYLHGPNGNIQGAVPKSSTLDSEQISKINILVTLKTKKSSCVVNLRDIGTDLQSLYIKAAVSTFEFRACTNPEAGIVEGILRYHPFLYDKETYPKDPDAQDAPDVLHGDVEENEYNTDINAQKQKKPVFECYWNGRLIPYTTVQDFDWCSQPSKGSKVPIECYNRFSGVLFTDDTFKVTENKLTFIDLEQKLKNKDTIFTVVLKGQNQRTNLQKEFSQWLQSCHEKFDKQVKFMNYQGTISRNDIPTKRNQFPWTTFSKIEWDGKIYQAGDYIKSLKTAPIYNGKVNRFLLFGTHDHEGHVYGPGGQVEINLEPKGLYDKAKIIPLSKIDSNATDEEIKKSINNDSAKLPDKLEVTWPKGNPWPDNATCPAGTVLGPINVKILNKKGDSMSCLPSVGRGVLKKLSVVLRLVHHVPKGDQEILAVEADHSPKWNFWFKEIGNILALGKYTLHLITIQTETKANEFGERRLPHFKLRFTIKEDVANQFDVAAIGSTLRIGVPFNISLRFKDRHGHAVEPPPDLKPTLQCSGLDVTYEQVECRNIMYIKNVKVKGKVRNHLEPNLHDLKVTIDGLREHSKTVTITVLPGNPHSIQVIPKENPVEVENGSTIKWSVMVQDEDGNPTATPKMTARCVVPHQPPANINCMAGIGEYVSKPINLSLTHGKPQSLQVRFSVPSQKGIEEVTREVLVLPSKRVIRIKIYEKDACLELKNNEKIDWMAGAVLGNLYFMLYDEGDREVPITAEVASKIKANWTGNIDQKELMKGKLPDVTVPTKAHADQFYQVSYQDQSVTASFIIVPIPDVPAGLKVILPKCIARLGEMLPGNIILELVDRYDNVTKTLKPSCVNEIIVEGEDLDQKALKLKFEESSCSVVVTGVRFISGTPGSREMSFTFGDFTYRTRLKVAAGIPAKLTLISGQAQFMNVLNGHGIPTPFVIQLCDQWDNPSPDQRVVVKILASSELNMSINVSSQPVNAEGQASFTVTCVSGPKGSYALNFKGIFKKEPIPGPSVNLTVLPDPNKPVSLEVEYDKRATFIAGELLPAFLVTVMSDEGRPIITRQAVSMQYWKGDSRNPGSNTPIEFQCCEPKENEKKDIFYFREKPVPEHVGKYTIQFFLHDPKNKITLCSDPILVNVVANRPMKLAPENPPPTQVVSYSEDIAKRMLVENMTLMIMDQYGNPAGQGLNGVVKISIENLNSASRENVPLFEDKSINCRIKLENGKAHVSNLAIMKKSPGVHGVTYMVLFRPEISPRIPGSLDSYEFHFSFSNDEENQKIHVALCRKRDAVKDAIIQIKKRQTQHTKLMEEYDGLLKKLSENEANLRNKLRNEWNEDLTENTSIEMVDRILHEKQLEARSIWNTPRRTCKIPCYSKGPDVIGKVGHLAYVMDDFEAWVISWHIRGDMDCIVTTTYAAAKEILRLTNGKQQILPIEGINPSYKRPLLPLPHIQNGRVLFAPRGNPRYAADVLIYPDNRADCEIVFRTLLGRTILIDDLDSANHYRQSVVRCNVMCPTILTKQGERVSASGKFGGAQNKAPPMHQLEIFGAPLPEHFSSLQKNIEHLKQYRVALEKKLQQIKEQNDTFSILEPKIKKNRESLGIMDKQLQEIEIQLATPLKRVHDSGGETSGITTKRAKLGSK
ncbi:LOW QUALITY PROTEIN: structural maintenance of chromosomes flexible hinge domain-containing protein 1 [Boleophthalmus pectinirostris]|uniref:LOW QUALITY PROTEIN: structural maintenance of chromosomes flexible hinge domain-containing protein 1 n=1 Tax=Boleophthalmus pectinirostris TaxID=150288 RepID=UPI002432F2F8|nr:LOW QUALITY PROTEIN: structural maintenance of chromosomes flexible hinge domain-containing protein 1 [Boleophthalmus pectinirostris]